MIKRLKSAWSSFKNPQKNVGARELELEQLVREIYDWTNYKNTTWAKRAKNVLNS